MTVLVAVVVARLVVPLAIPRYPLPGIVAALLLDAVDESVFQWAAGDGLRGYQTYDKALDVYYLTIAYAATIRNWRGGFIFRVGRALWYYRLIGVVLFEVTGARWLLFVFANTFEYYFVVIEFVKLTRSPFVLTRLQVLRIVAFVWIVIKLPQEWWIHVAQLDFTAMLRRVVFGVPADASWLEALGNRPEGVVVVAAVVVVVVACVYLLARRLPPRTWPPTVSADAQARRLGWPLPPTTAVPVVHVGRPLIEKVVLVALVTLIFSQILPGERNASQVVSGVALIIAATLIVNRFLARRRVTWHSTTLQFLVMAAINIVVGLAVGALLATPGTQTPLGAFVFLIALLTLIIVLFDHFGRVGGR